MPSPAALSSHSQPAQPPAAGSRPPLFKRHSSASSSGLSLDQPQHAQAQRHQPRHANQRHHHAKVVLPRNHNSARNLTKVGRQHAHHASHGGGEVDGKRHSRQRSHEADTEIRLPGSLDEARERPAMRRNMTASELPRTKSATKLKKNASHGQLTRLQSGRSLASANASSHKTPLSPALKGKAKRPKSSDMTLMPIEKDLHEQEVELLRQQQAQRQPQQKKVGFAVGSAGDDTSEEDAPQMEGSGLQDDEWTDQSASASPYSTRQNTANNSRRPSLAVEKAQDRLTALQPLAPVTNQPASRQTVVDGVPLLQMPEVQSANEEARESSSDTEEEMVSPTSQPLKTAKRQSHAVESTPAVPRPSSHQPPLEAPQQSPNPSIRSPLHAAKDHPNPTKRLTSSSLPAPALVSSVSALDSMHSSQRGSPDPSLHSNHATDGALDQASETPENEELISRFIPSASHPDNTTASGANTGAAHNTPKQSSFQHPPSSTSFHPNPTSPGSSTLSATSSFSNPATPNLARSRTELRLQHDKALAAREALAERQPLIPHHIYDRRNETLKSYLNLATLGSTTNGGGGLNPTQGLSLGPEIFQGRFRAVEAELRVVGRFRDPVAEAAERVRKLRARDALAAKKKGVAGGRAEGQGLRGSKSAVALAPAGARGIPAAGGGSGSGPGSSLPSAAGMGAPSTTTTTTTASAPKATAQGTSAPGMQRAASTSTTTAKGFPTPTSAPAPPGLGRRGVSFAGTAPEPQPVRPRTPAGKSETLGERALDSIARSLWDGGGVRGV